MEFPTTVWGELIWLGGIRIAKLFTWANLGMDKEWGRDKREQDSFA
jgi:hypothetical protein